MFRTARANWISLFAVPIFHVQMPLLDNNNNDNRFDGEKCPHFDSFGIICTSETAPLGPAIVTRIVRQCTSAHVNFKIHTKQSGQFQYPSLARPLRALTYTP